jgi:hypothetical protein
MATDALLARGAEGDALESVASFTKKSSRPAASRCDLP